LLSAQVSTVPLAAVSVCNGVPSVTVNVEPVSASVMVTFAARRDSVGGVGACGTVGVVSARPPGALFGDRGRAAVTTGASLVPKMVMVTLAVSVPPLPSLIV
jgi:hypothetical protein